MVCGGGSVQAGTVTPMAVVLTRAAMLFNAELRRARRRRTGFWEFRAAHESDRAFRKARSRRNYRNWRDRPLRPNLIWLVATRFLVRLLVPLDS